MSCNNCVRHVTGALNGLSGVTGVIVSLEEKTAAIEHGDQVTLDMLSQAVEEAGYEVSGYA